MKNKIYSLLFYNLFFKRIGACLLNSSWFVNNFVYQSFIRLYIKKIINKYRLAPNNVIIENTNFCNSRCLMCPHNIMKRKQGVMDEKLFKKIIDECVQNKINKIVLHNFGEPLMDKNFVARIKYAKSKGIADVGTSTNASLLSKTLSEEIIASGLDGINFSLDAFSKNAYEKIRIGLPYDKVMKNVKEFISIRNRLGKKKPFVIVDLIETEFNKNETKPFIKRWKNLADKVNITTLHTWGGSFKDQAGEEKFHFKNQKIIREPCRFLWTDMVINWDGRVSACCQDYEANMVVGDINKTSLKEIWQGKTLESLRENHLQGNYSKIPMCNFCDYRSVWWLFK